MTDELNCKSCIKERKTCHVGLHLLGISSSMNPEKSYTKCYSCGEEWIDYLPDFKLGVCT